MTDSASSWTHSDPASMGEDPDPALDHGGIDPEDTEVVPAALADLVTAARATCRAMEANGCYPAVMAVMAVEDTVAALARVGSVLQPYAGDYSAEGGAAVVRANGLLGQARVALSDARHHLTLDHLTQSDPTTPAAAR